MGGVIYHLAEHHGTPLAWRGLPRFGLTRYVLVAPTDREAHEVARPAFADHHAGSFAWGSPATDASLRSLRLFRDEVVPAVRAAVGER